MFNLNYDFTGAEVVDLASDFVALTSGNYTLKITEAELKTSQKGNQYLALTCETSEAHKIFENVVIGEEKWQKDRLFSFIKLLNPNFQGGAITKGLFVGKPFNAEIKLETYENRDGQERMKGVITKKWQFAGVVVNEPTPEPVYTKNGAPKPKTAMSAANEMFGGGFAQPLNDIPVNISDEDLPF